MSRRDEYCKQPVSSIYAEPIHVMRSITTRVFRFVQRWLVRIRARFTIGISLSDWLTGTRNTIRVAIIVAHPDDEVFCGGLICSLRKLDIPVSLFLLTHGEGASRSPVLKAELAELRSAEVSASGAALGISEIKCFGYEDPPVIDGCRRAPDVTPDVLATRIRAWIVDAEVNLIVVHGSDGEYGHPAHVLLHEAVQKVLRTLAGVSAIGMNAWRPQFEIPQLLNRRDVPRVLVDGSPFAAQRLQSLKSHKTQCYIFEQWANGTAEDYVRLTEREWYSFL